MSRLGCFNCAWAQVNLISASDIIWYFNIFDLWICWKCDHLEASCVEKLSSLATAQVGDGGMFGRFGHFWHLLQTRCVETCWNTDSVQYRKVMDSSYPIDLRIMAWNFNVRHKEVGFNENDTYDAWWKMWWICTCQQQQNNNEAEANIDLWPVPMVIEILKQFRRSFLFQFFWRWDSWKVSWGFCFGAWGNITKVTFFCCCLLYVGGVCDMYSMKYEIHADIVCWFILIQKRNPAMLVAELCLIILCRRLVLLVGCFGKIADGDSMQL